MNNPLNAPKGVLQILFAAAEADPFIKVGGLGDVAGSLPAALRALDPELTGGYLLDVRLAIPFHGAISICPEDCKPVAVFPVRRVNGPVEAQVFEANLHGLPVYLIAGDAIPREAPVYSMDTARDGEKYTFFSLAILEMTRHLAWQPDVLHANDWHTAASVYALERLKLQDDAFFANTRSVLTVHNLPFMGAGTSDSLRAYNLPPSDDPYLPDWARYFPLPMGLSTASDIVTVSPTYAREILTPEYGSGLQDFLKTRQDSISGILNGLDQASWDPSTDTAILKNYTSSSLAARVKNKTALLEEFGLNPDPSIPLLIFIGRLDHQKGVEIAVEGLRQVTDLPWQAILLGTGDLALEYECRRLEADLPDRVRAAIRFDPNLSRRLYSAADCLMIPSHYEPCGLVQMIAMRYGCIPVARAVGGLLDTIIDLPEPGKSTGFLFTDASANALADALRRALAEIPKKTSWQARQKNAMKQDFSWQHPAAAYSAVYSHWRV